jgi:hypothetical protein
MTACLIACEIFRSALVYLQIQRRYTIVSIHYLPGHLHMQPVELKRRILAQIRLARERNEPVGCIYGHCFEDIDEILQKEMVPRIHTAHCFEILLGGDRFRQIIQDQAGTFFMEKELIENFQKYCWEPLELHDPQMRSWYFEHYRQAVYIRQPLDPDLTAKARQIAEALDLRLRIADADYDELDRAVHHLIGDLDKR